MDVQNAYEFVNINFGIGIDTMTPNDAHREFGRLYTLLLRLYDQPEIPGLTSDYWREKRDVLVGLAGKWGYNGQPGQYRDENDARNRLTRDINFKLERAGRHSEMIPQD